MYIEEELVYRQLDREEFKIDPHISHNCVAYKWGFDSPQHKWFLSLPLSDQIIQISLILESAFSAIRLIVKRNRALKVEQRNKMISIAKFAALELIYMLVNDKSSMTKMIGEGTIRKMNDENHWNVYNYWDNFENDYHFKISFQNFCVTSDKPYVDNKDQFPRMTPEPLSEHDNFMKDFADTICWFFGYCYTYQETEYNQNDKLSDLLNLLNGINTSRFIDLIQKIRE